MIIKTNDWWIHGHQPQEVYVVYGGKPGPEVIKLFSCSTQLSIKFFLFINVKMSTIVGILTIMNRKNSILDLSEPKKCWVYWYFYTYEHLKFHAQLSWAWKKFYNLGARIAFSGLPNINILCNLRLHSGCTDLGPKPKCLWSRPQSDVRHQIVPLWLVWNCFHEFHQTSQKGKA